MAWETVIGLEIHAQLATKSKIFSGSSTEFGAPPNTQASIIDLAMPGVLPVLNQEAVAMAVTFGLAINADIAPRSVFARKNYFYPDLPKGYQISQYELPIVGHGFLDIDIGPDSKRIEITRAHLEEDAGKSLHEAFPQASGIDLNRAGTALLEIVSEPDMRSAAEAVAYLREIHAIVRYLRICDGNMQEGSFRCDANVSVRPAGSSELGTRTELKNLNSFRSIEKAINYEVERQIDRLQSGRSIVQETRLYDPDKDMTRPMRSKEEANDYRYFPDPDLLPVAISAELLDDMKSSLPELPRARRQRFAASYELSETDADLLTASREMADYYEQTVGHAQGASRLAANWIIGELTANLKRSDLDLESCPITAAGLGGLIARIADQTISGKIAKDVFEEIWQGRGEADAIIAEKGLEQLTDDDAIELLIDQVLTDNPTQVEQYRAGKDKVFGFFVGQAMKASKGKANPKQVNDILHRLLGDPGKS